MWFSFRPYVSVGQRTAKAAQEVARRRKKGDNVSPVILNGKKIASTFWGKAWCDNLESYSDYANRLPRGRSYIRNGLVVDLQIHPGKITALVNGSSLYKITIQISPLVKNHWHDVKSRCAGEIGSLVELLQGKLSKSVMDIVTDRNTGLFPKPAEIKLACSCPDWASMCKHVAAVLYGVGARLDHQPELLFVLRQVDHLELIQGAIPDMGKKARTGTKTLGKSDVASVFGIDIAESEPASPAPAVADAMPKKQRGAKKPVSKSRKRVKVLPPKTMAAKKYRLAKQA